MIPAAAAQVEIAERGAIAAVPVAQVWPVEPDVVVPDEIQVEVAARVSLVVPAAAVRDAIAGAPAARVWSVELDVAVLDEFLGEMAWAAWLGECLRRDALA
ncbi:MAG TPA: hypothetical protein VHY20_12330 [Pirellulales bacterium]|nr:hypothetical protein [Pirellulales bacterium]